MVNLLAILSYVIFALAPLTQTWAIWKKRDSQGVALAWPILFNIAMVMVAPGIIETGRTTLVAGHLSGLAANLANLGFILRFRRRQPSG